MMLPIEINLDRLKEAITTRHHFAERFFDIDEAEIDRKANLELADRIEDGSATQEDFAKAQSLISNPY
ncbi:hypothetical protein Acj61p002 [Acinetobacter phage Acj61]|uniref:Uncharacterized protein n=1 Tax=Acinetobacter phage Acj61 TaxID=760732 RepID=E5E3Y3_9CAUD|nr:hypothetical protein Acj61p002 [Acinetobacter phage Acj61]ADG35967.1 hypothetical protein Acj61p002 [Acinetobacter phage Acj61]